MKFVLLSSFDNYIPAHIALGKLKEAFINCYLQDEHSVTIDPLLSNAIGGIKLMVAETQLERARQILNSLEE
ncbi:MAG: putative signal transducing protein [Chitinophagaceae bacterium]